MSLVVMDCPGGYVCRLSRTRDFEVPLSIARINTQLVPILKLILKAKVYIYIYSYEQSSRLNKFEDSLGTFSFCSR